MRQSWQPMPEKTTFCTAYHTGVQQGYQAECAQYTGDCGQPVHQRIPVNKKLPGGFRHIQATAVDENYVIVVKDLSEGDALRGSLGDVSCDNMQEQAYDLSRETLRGIERVARGIESYLRKFP